MVKIILTLVALLFLVASPDTANFVEKNGQLKVEGNQLVNSEEIPIQLRGMSFAWHNWWPQYWNKETVGWLVDDWNCTVVRAVMGVEPDNAYLTDSVFAIEKVKKVVDAAIDEGIYVIIDWHAHHLNLEPAIEFFKLMAETYGEYPNVIYEIFNEPDGEVTWPEVKQYSINVINAIREIDSDNIILVGSPHWDQDLHLVADDPISNHSNIIYTLHFYAATHGDYLFERGDYALSKGIPIFVSECAGMEATGDGPVDKKALHKWVNWMEDNKLSYVFWSISDKDETCSILYPSASSQGSWKDEDLKEWGKISRSIMKRNNTDY